MSGGTAGQTAWRRRVTEAAVGLFSHAPDPLVDTFSHPGDPGLFGPDSVTWRVMRYPYNPPAFNSSRIRAFQEWI